MSNSSLENPGESPVRSERSSARLVITPEEALTVPDSALRVETQIRVTSAREPGFSNRAIVSLSLGILGTPLVGLLVGWFAIWFGILALRQMDGPEPLQGRGMALSGIVLGGLDIVLWIVLFVFYGHALFSYSIF